MIEDLAEWRVESIALISGQMLCHAYVRSFCSQPQFDDCDFLLITILQLLWYVGPKLRSRTFGIAIDTEVCCRGLRSGTFQVYQFVRIASSSSTAELHHLHLCDNALNYVGDVAGTGFQDACLFLYSCFALFMRRTLISVGSNKCLDLMLTIAGA